MGLVPVVWRTTVNDLPELQELCSEIIRCYLQAETLSFLILLSAVISLSEQSNNYWIQRIVTGNTDDVMGPQISYFSSVQMNFRL